MLIRRNLESSHYETYGSGNYDGEYYIDDSGDNEDEVGSNDDEFEAYARALQEAEDRLLTTQMMASASINDGKPLQ